jgi:hypothetical protein
MHKKNVPGRGRFSIFSLVVFQDGILLIPEEAILFYRVWDCWFSSASVMPFWILVFSVFSHSGF